MPKKSISRIFWAGWVTGGATCSGIVIGCEGGVGVVVMVGSWGFLSPGFPNFLAILSKGFLVSTTISGFFSSF